ncbi:MAG TPA: large conductance mechanosensitive channel protein MscL [Bacteroidia bacterium]
MGFIKEFKEFVLRRNVFDLAVGVIIGATFNKLISSLIEDVITPLLLVPILEGKTVSTLQTYSWHGAKLGMFLSSIITFFITALVLFLMIKGMNAADKKKKAQTPTAPPEITTTDKLLMEIRDLLNNKSA